MTPFRNKNSANAYSRNYKTINFLLKHRKESMNKYRKVILVITSIGKQRIKFKKLSRSDFVNIYKYSYILYTSIYKNATNY